MGRGRKGMSTKIHVGLAGNYLRGVCLSEGQRTDMKVFSTLWAKGDWRQINDVIADKGYDFYDVKKLIRDSGKYPIIPRCKGALYPGIQPKDKEKYKTRNAIERFFGKIKEHKRLALRFDKLDITFFSFFAIACLKVFKLLC
ncbi:transposase [Candidatus Regiella endosymbiont of Tuberolachnus salignus]|uniref:transposase n=1 Tax=Candidatus Regiella endosymbiont of Tuberolachnus salignus TaxID=3077956 RepID=UPI0030CF22B2